MFTDDVDYESQDAERDQTLEWLRDRLPWLSHQELDEATSSEPFPGVFAGMSALIEFVEAQRASVKRIVECRVTVSGLTIPARLDLVQRTCSVTGESGQERIGFEGPAQFQLVNGRRRLSGFLDDGVATLMSNRDMWEAVEELKKAGTLPPLKESMALESA